MARYTNQAQMTYNGNTVNSNIAVGEILESLSVNKTVLQSAYGADDRLTYVISIVNSSAAAQNGLTVTDNLGAYSFGTPAQTLYPLAYREGTLSVLINGVVQTTGLPNVTAGPPLTFTGVNVPANSNMLLIYEAEPTAYAPLGTGASVRNTATLSGPGITTLVAGSSTIASETTPRLSIVKTIDPVPVSSGDTVTYTFTIQNYGNTAADAATAIALTDTFSPVLTGITVNLNGSAFSTANYTYTESTGAFATNAGTITVPAATYTQDPGTGAYTTTPGVATLTVSGTI